MSCETWRPLLLWAAENRLGEMKGSDRHRLLAHLEQCADCRQALEDQRAVREALTGHGDARVPDGFAARVAAAVRAESAWESNGGVAPGWGEVFRWRTWSFRLAPLAAGLLVFGVVTARTARGAADDQQTLGLVELAEAWAFGEQSLETRPAFTVWGRGDVSGEVLLDAILSAEPDEPLAEGDAS